MKIPVKDGEAEIDPTWIAEWNRVFFSEDVLFCLEKARLWVLANPERRKTRRGLRKFLNNWIVNDARRRPQPAKTITPDEPRPTVDRTLISGALSDMKSKLKEVKGEDYRSDEAVEGSEHQV